MFLLYCMCEPGSTPGAGIRSAEIKTMASEGTALLYSAFTPSPHSIKDDALAFHQTNEQIFKDRIVIPFRFPTTVENASAVHDFLSKHAAEYRAELERLRDFVQMDVVIHEQRQETLAAASGTDYLKRRQTELHSTESLLKQIQSAPSAKEWKQSRRPGVIKLSALVKRGDEDTFKQHVAAETARVTGPWPPAAFVNCYPETD